MVAAFVAAAALSFLPDAPISEQVTRGRVIAAQPDQDQWQKLLNVAPQTAQLVPIEHLYLQDRISIGTWSDGLRNLDVEWVIRLSPALMSRWIGYLQYRELWTDAEAIEQWKVLQALYGEDQLFIVILSAFPRQNLLDPGATERTSTREMDNLVVRFEQDHQLIGARVQEIYHTRGRSRSELDQIPWWSMLPLKAVLEPRFQEPFEPPVLARGDFIRSWYLVSPDEPVAERFSLKIASQRKIRTAEFGAPHRR